MAQHNILGKNGEDLAASHLENKGYVILEKNWRYNKAEVDIIASAEGFVVIVEVKTRATDYYGKPEEAVTKNKQRLLCEAANAYVQLKDMDKEVRFDIVSIISNGQQTKLHHIIDAFYPYSSELDG